MSETGSDATGTDEEVDDPGRDPVGLHPPRDILNAPGGMTDDPGYTPQQPSEAERRAGSEPDAAPTGTGEGGP